jgi:hypothetical protein
MSKTHVIWVWHFITPKNIRYGYKSYQLIITFYLNKNINSKFIFYNPKK